MRRWRYSYYVSVRNRSPYGKMSVCDALSTKSGWANYVIVDDYKHAARLTLRNPVKYRHIDLYEWKRSGLHRCCIWDKEWRE